MGNHVPYNFHTRTFNIVVKTKSKQINTVINKSVNPRLMFSDTICVRCYFFRMNNVKLNNHALYILYLQWLTEYFNMAIKPTINVIVAISVVELLVLVIDKHNFLSFCCYLLSQ